MLRLGPALLLASWLSTAFLLPPQQYRLIRENSSGELPLVHFKNLVRFSGFAPSEGADQTAQYLADQARRYGLSGVEIESLSAHGERYVWSFRDEPAWDGRRAELWVVKPQRERLADFSAYRGYLARFSRSASVTAEVVDVGQGTGPGDYAGRSVEGRIVLATGNLPVVHRLAVWERKAAGIIFFRTADAESNPDLVSMLQISPWEGPRGEPPAFAFSLPYRAGNGLRQRLAAGESLTVRAEVEADTRPGAYPVVRAEIPGLDLSLPAILVYAHTNHRNTGGANNLTGVGCTVEVARLLSQLIRSGALPRPRRTIRFMWGAEHYGIIYHFHEHPEDVARILAMVNVDMIGFHQERSKAVFHLYRAPESRPSFLSDILEAFTEQVGQENTISIRNADIFTPRGAIGFRDPLFAPTGSRDAFQYNIEKFWGPSDHEDVSDGAIGLPAVLLNDFPDIFLGTQEDNERAVDPTQMRRGVVLTAAAAYGLASASPAGLPGLLHNALRGAETRVAQTEARAFSYLEQASPQSLPAAYQEASNLVRQAFRSERVALQSLRELVGVAAFPQPAQFLLASFANIEPVITGRLEKEAQTLAAEHGVSLDRAFDPRLSKMVPQRTGLIRGPLNFFRIEYGRWWLIEKTGDEHFERQVALARRGHYPLFEALNFADGRRSIREIRDALSAEFEPVPADEVEQYFQFLERVGVIRLIAAP